MVYSISDFVDDNELVIHLGRQFGLKRQFDNQRRRPFSWKNSYGEIVMVTCLENVPIFYEDGKQAIDVRCTKVTIGLALVWLAMQSLMHCKVKIF